VSYVVCVFFHESFVAVGDVMFCSLSLKMADSLWVHVHSFVYGFRMERFFFLLHTHRTHQLIIHGKNFTLHLFEDE
jgi:hypothetical protein